MTNRKKYLSLFLSIATVSATSLMLPVAPAQAVVACADGGTCSYGDLGPGGGKVFITPLTAGNSTGKYFELAPASTEAMSAWCGDGIGARNTATLIGTSTAIGTGKTNTDAIIAFCGGASAADTTASYRGGGFSDWFLPSKDELNAQYWNLKVGSLDTFNAGDVYTSSSESTTSTVWDQDINEIYGPRLTSGYFQRNFTKNKNDWWPIFNRPVRMFNPGDAASSGGSSNNNGDSERREVERKRQAEIDYCKSNLKIALSSNQKIEPGTFMKCGYRPLGLQSEVILVSILQLLAVESRTSDAVISQVVTKTGTYEDLQGSRAKSVTVRQLVTTGIIEASAPNKTVITLQLQKLESVERDSISEIDAFIAAETKRMRDRKTHLAATIAKIQGS